MPVIFTEIEAYDMISELGQENVVEYEAEAARIDVIIPALLALQERTPAITLGIIHADYEALTRSIKVDGDSILRAIYRLRDTVGGYIYVDNNLALQWAKSIGADTGQQIRYGKNLTGISRSIDYTKLCNRLYAYGVGEGSEARIKLSDADGHAVDYVEDGASQATWDGIYIKVIVDKSITHPNTLKAWADLRLADVKDPPTTYTINTLDLYEYDREKFAFDQILLGSTVQVIDEDLGIDVSTTVVSIEHPDLLDPMNMTIQLSNKQRDITDTLLDTYDRQQLDSHNATVIGAGQVTINGTVFITDWISGGTTTINGAKITTGTVVLGALDFVPLSSTGTTDQVIATINASAEGGGVLKIAAAKITLDGVVAVTADIQASNYVADTTGWIIHGDGSAEFNNVKIRGTLYTSELEASSTLKSTNYVADTAGWVIDGDGSAEFNSVKIRGTLYTSTIEASSDLKSSNYVAATTGWMIDGDGTAEFNNVIVRGNLQAGAGTSIDGGYIVANSITTSELNFTPLYSSDATGSIIATINATAEGISIEGDNIKISGDTEFEASSPVIIDIIEDLASNANSAQKDVVLADAAAAARYTAGDIILLVDDSDSETCEIASIADDTLTMEDNLTNSYTTAANAYVILYGAADNINNGVTTISGGLITTGTIVANKMNVTTLAAIVADLGTINAGDIRLGSGTLGVDFTGIRIYESGAVYRVAGYDDDTVQCYIDSDGKFKSGDGTYITIDDSGMVCKGESIFFKAPNGDARGQIYGPATYDLLYITATGSIRLAPATAVHIMSEKPLNMYGASVAVGSLQITDDLYGNIGNGTERMVLKAISGSGELICYGDWIPYRDDAYYLGGESVEDGDDYGWADVVSHHYTTLSRIKEVKGDVLEALKNIKAVNKLGKDGKYGDEMDVHTMPDELLTQGRERVNATGRSGVDLVSEVWFAIRSLQALVERVEALEAK